MPFFRGIEAIIGKTSRTKLAGVVKRQRGSAPAAESDVILQVVKKYPVDIVSSEFSVLIQSLTININVKGF